MYKGSISLAAFLNQNISASRHVVCQAPNVWTRMYYLFIYVCLFICDLELFTKLFQLIYLIRYQALH
jgi:hypothetical protein